MQTRMLVQAITTLAILGGCASTEYKEKDDFTDFGYKETKVSENNYMLEYYGAKSDTYKKLEGLWRKRAEELCNSKTYKADFEIATYEGNTFMLVPPFVFDKKGWPLLKGKLNCGAS